MTRVLFIGNSYTYYNEMPAMTAYLSHYGAPGVHPIETERSTIPGATLQNLWNDGHAITAIQSQHWDYVVLQARRMEPLESPDVMFAYAHKFDTEIHAAGAKTVIFLTWETVEHPGSQPTITDAYLRLGQELGAKVAPVGIAFQKVRTAHSPINVLAGDTFSHPNATGSYLAALTFLATIQGSVPENPPTNVPVPSTIPPAPTLSIDPTIEPALRQAAQDAIAAVPANLR